MNIQNAYSDPRFKREIDEVEGYKTKHILCIPIKADSTVIGVIKMTNKRDGAKFDHDDEASFKILSTVFGLALHNAKLYGTLMTNEQKYRATFEVMSYHNTCLETEVMTMIADKEPVVDLNNFNLDPAKLEDFQKCKLALNMFTDLFGMTKFDKSTITRFVLTVKNNHRKVPYHNFDHGLSVAHSMYLMLKGDDNKRFNYKMRLALFVACLCHDLDYKDYTNKNISGTASPLAALYGTSSVEYHNFNMTVNILQQEGHNILAHFDSEDYYEILAMIRHCILATDLAKFSTNLEEIKQLLEDEPSSFNWAFSTHCDLAMAMAMTAADLSAVAKPWYIEIKTVGVIFKDFCDKEVNEKTAVKMDIPTEWEIPANQFTAQVDFLIEFGLPCFEVMYKLLPNTEPMYLFVRRNLNSKIRAIKNQA